MDIGRGFLFSRQAKGCQGHSPLGPLSRQRASFGTGQFKDAL